MEQNRRAERAAIIGFGCHQRKPPHWEAVGGCLGVQAGKYFSPAMISPAVARSIPPNLIVMLNSNCLSLTFAARNARLPSARADKGVGLSANSLIDLGRLVVFMITFLGLG